MGWSSPPNEHTLYVARLDCGVELSGGEWQKIALARTCIRDAQVLLLDEPTASLDARAEYDVFLRSSHLVRGKMAVIISHRFSTVCMADRIIVLQHGTVVEDGTHEALLAQGGLYATLFVLQVEGYRQANGGTRCGAGRVPSCGTRHGRRCYVPAHGGPWGDLTDRVHGGQHPARQGSRF
jgi:translation initiation factor RLI1